MPQFDSQEQSVVAIYALHSDADNAINLLKKGNFNIKRLAIVGKSYHTEEDVVGYYNTGDQMKHWGKMGAFWGGLWGLLVGSAFFLIPGVGPVVVAGSAVTWIVGALESAVVVGGLSALGAGALQQRNLEGQRPEVREFDQSGEVLAHGAWNARRGGGGASHSGEHGRGRN